MADKTETVTLNKGAGNTDETVTQTWVDLGDGTHAPKSVATGGLTDAEMRAVDTEDVTIANGAALSSAFDMRGRLGGHVVVPDSWSDANLGFKVCDTLGGTYVVAKDETGAPIQISGINTTNGASYAIPTKMFPCHFVKVWSKHKTAATETDVNQTGAKAIKIVLK